MTLSEFIENRKKELPVTVPLRELEDLVGFCTGKSWSEIQLTKNNCSIGEAQQERFGKLFDRLKAGEPLAYLIGEKDFYKSVFKVTPDVLIPRPETEILVERALECLSDKQGLVFDIGAGSGCIGLSLARECPASQVYLFEASQRALEVCHKNGQSLGLSNVEYLCAAIGEGKVELPALVENVDLIVANPPYISQGDERVHGRVSQFEPHQALYAKDNGLFWIHKWLIWGYDYLKVGGVYIFEFGQGQEKAILPIIQKRNFKQIELVRDYSGNNRFYKLIK